MASSSPRTQPPLLLSGSEAASLLGLSRSAFYRLNLKGLVPRAIRFGRLMKWSRTELTAWVDAGCPAREEWERRS